MRNKYKFATILLVISLFLPVVVLAQERNNMPARMTDAQHERMDRISGLKRVALTQVQRTEKAIKQLSEMIGKIERAMNAQKEKGVDISSLQASVEKAKALKAEAERMLADLKSKHAAIDTESSEPKRQVQEFQTSMNAIKKKLNELHRSLMDVVKQMRVLEKPIKSEETE